MLTTLHIVLAMADHNALSTQPHSDSDQKEIKLQDTVSRSLAKDVTFTSFQHGKVKVRQIGNSLERIQDFIFCREKLCIYPGYSKEGDGKHRILLQQRIRSLFSEGFVFNPKSLAIAANIETSTNNPDTLQDTLLIVPGRPGCVFCTIKDKISRRQVMKYVVSLSKGVVKSVRQFSDEHFSVVYGIITMEDLSSDDNFESALKRLEEKTAIWSVPASLSMNQDKYKKVVQAFILSISITKSMSESEDDPLWCMTPEQFRTIMENLQEKKLLVKAMPHCGQQVVMLELASRLEKSGPTALVSQSEDLRKNAERRCDCKFVMTPKEFSETRKNVANVVTDCSKDIDVKVTGSVWRFMKQKEPYEVPISATESLKKRDSPQKVIVAEQPRHTVVDQMMNEVYIRKREGYVESSSIIALSRTMKELSLMGNETTKPVTFLPSTLGDKMSVIQAGFHGTPVNLTVSVLTRQDDDYVERPQVRLKGKTKHEIDTYTRDTVKLEIVSKIITKLQVARVITITGLPGEGKTTLGYIILKEYLKKGYNVYAIRTPEEFYRITNVENSVLMFNDIFGSFHFDQSEFGKWIPVLEDLTRVTNNPVQTTTMCLFISRDYVLQKAMRKLEKFTNLLFSKSKILNLSAESLLTRLDKKNMYKFYQSKNPKASSLSSSEIERLIDASFPYGFAHCCQLFFSLDTDKEPFEFFQNPRLFLDATISAHFNNDVYKRAAFYLMLYSEGTFDISWIFLSEKDSPEQREMIIVLEGIVEGSEKIPYGSHDDHLLKLQESFDSMIGLFLKKEDQMLTFAHSSIYESVANIICHKNTRFIIEHCNVNSLDYFIHFDKTGAGFSYLNVPLPAECVELLVARFARELNKGHLSSVLRHSLFTTAQGVSLFLSRIDLAKANGLIDIKTKQSFCYLICSNGDCKLLEEMIHAVIFTTEMIKDVIFGCCEYGNERGLLLIQSLMRGHNFKYRPSTAETALTLAIDNNFPNMVDILLSDIDLERRRLFDHNKVFLIAAVKGLESTVKTFLDFGVAANTEDDNGWNALHYACSRGNVELARLLVNRGSDVNQRTREGFSPLHLAAKGGHLELIRKLRMFGGLVVARTLNGETLLHMAVLSGNIEVVKEICGYRVNVNQKTVKEGQTALMYAITQNFSDAVEIFIKYRLIMFVVDNTRNSVIHLAAKYGFVDLVRLILSKASNVSQFIMMYNPNKEGLTPLLIAAQNGDEQMIVELLRHSPGSIEVSGPLGYTSLCITLQKGHIRACRQLLILGANVHHVCKDGSTPLHLAVQFNWSSNFVSYFLRKGVNVNARDKQNATPLSLAVKNKSLGLTQLLISNKADVNIVDKKGYSPLHYACLEDKVPIAKVLLDGSCKLNKADREGCTALIMASRNGSSELVKALINRGASVEIRNKKSETALHLAAKYGHWRTSEILIQAGADVNTQDLNKENPLYDSALKNHAQLVFLLLRSGANVNITRFDEKTPLHTASDMGNAQVVQILIDHGADVNRADNRDWSSYHFASQNGHVNVVRILYENGGDCNKQTNEGMTCMHLACCRGHNELLLYLLQLGCRTDISDKVGFNVLHYAGSFCDRKTVSFLLAKGLDVNVSSTQGIKPLHMAAEKGSLAVAQELIDRGADINATTRTGDSPLKICCLKGHDELVSVLLQLGAKLEIENRHGMTPLIAASISGHKRIVEKLLTAGADVNHSDKSGQSALHFASANGHLEIVSELLRVGANQTLTTKGFLPGECAIAKGHTGIYTLLVKNMSFWALAKKWGLIFLQVIAHEASNFRS